MVGAWVVGIAPPNHLLVHQMRISMPVERFRVVGIFELSIEKYPLEVFKNSKAERSLIKRPFGEHLERHFTWISLILERANKCFRSNVF